ncbi:MAG: DCL family protein [Alphaproteobacteria bacterium]
MKAKPVVLGPLSFPKKSDALAFLKTMLNRYSPGDRVSEVDEKILTFALTKHPEAVQKIGSGISHFSVQTAEYGTQCFWVVRTDGTTERFSYGSCLG